MDTMNEDTFAQITSSLDYDTLTNMYKTSVENRRMLNNPNVVFTMSVLRGFPVPVDKYETYKNLLEYAAEINIWSMTKVDMYIFLAKCNQLPDELEEDIISMLQYWNSKFIQYVVKNNIVKAMKQCVLRYLAYEFLKQGKQSIYQDEYAKLLWAIESGNNLAIHNTNILFKKHNEGTKNISISTGEYTSYIIGLNGRTDLAKLFIEDIDDQYLRIGYIEAKSFIEADKLTLPITNSFINPSNFDVNTYEYCKNNGIPLESYAYYLTTGNVLQTILLNNPNLLGKFIAGYISRDSIKELLFLIKLYPHLESVVAVIISYNLNLRGRVGEWSGSMYNKLGNLQYD